jgi:uncharacterized membrane protein (DUF485 family)
MARDLLLMLVAFAVGALVAGALGAVSLGVALGIGQLTFAGALVWILLRS